MGTVLLVIGIIGIVVGGIGMLLAGFRESAIWGIAMMVVPLVSLIFVVSHWEDAKKPFLIQVVGWMLAVVGAGLRHQ